VYAFALINNEFRSLQYRLNNYYLDVCAFVVPAPFLVEVLGIRWSREYYSSVSLRANVSWIF